MTSKIKGNDNKGRKSKSRLLKEAKEVDKRIEQFFSILSDDYPDLQLGTTGSVRYNSYEISMSREIAKKILTPRHYKEWELLASF